MMRALRPHLHGADFEIEFFEFLNFDVAGQFVERHGEVGAFHLAGEHADQALARAFAAQNPQPAARMINRPEERQALNMVPMRVREEQGQVERLVFEFRQQ